MAWSVTGNIRGPVGATGATGATGGVGPTGPTGPQGPTGAAGSQGQPGVSVDIQGFVATYGDLPSGAAPGDAYVVTADGKLYFRDATGFPADGSGVPFVGPQGPTGAAGSAGAQGPTGPTGAAGATGSAGERGSLWYTGTGVPSGISGAAPNDQFLDTASGDVYTYYA